MAHKDEIHCGETKWQEGVHKGIKSHRNEVSHLRLYRNEILNRELKHFYTKCNRNVNSSLGRHWCYQSEAK